MAELMNHPPNYDGYGPVPMKKWGVVYRDEREPSLPEYICLLWETRHEPGPGLGRYMRLNTATFLSFVPSDATPEQAVERARQWAGRPDHGVKPEDVYFWGVVRKGGGK